MNLLWVSCLFFLSVSFAHRHPSFCICSKLHHSVPLGLKVGVSIDTSLSPSLNTLPALNVCCNRKLLPLPRSKLGFRPSLLLLLAGDVAVNPGPVTRNLRIGTINTRSMRDKAPALSDLVVSKTLDILGITETWLSTNETTASLADITPTGFTLHHIPRSGRSGGGVGIFVSDFFRFSRISIPTFPSFEAICGRISNEKVGINVNVLTLYRPPGSDTRFMSEFQDVLSFLASLPQELIVIGDFNLHVDKPTNQTTVFLDLLSLFGLQQHVDFPTHIHGHPLDLIITSSKCSIASVTRSDRISDHFTVIAEVVARICSVGSRKTISFRNLKSIDIGSFKCDILNSRLFRDPADNATDMASQYNKELRTILDQHAPIKNKQVTSKPANPWITTGIQHAKRHRRYLERVWRKNPTAYNRSRFSKQTHLCNRLMSKAKSDYYSQVIEDNSSNPRSLWKAFNQILFRQPQKLLPECISLTDLAEKFGTYFISKITNIRSSFSTPNMPSSQYTQRPDLAPLISFSPVTESEILKLIKTAPAKSCDLDPIPTQLLKSCIDVLLTPITHLINLSLAEGIFPSAFKRAHVAPLLKKPSLSKEDMKNYRPVSNLSFISKLLEKVVANRIHAHMEETNTTNPFQSAYRKSHSTETALLRIHNDVLMAMDKGKVTALTLLDLSAAFDTIDHQILVNRLEKWYGISGSALRWLSSYLSDRSQQVKLGNHVSSGVNLPFGVPQGSVLGPLLFTMYTSPLSEIIDEKAVPHQLYADDTQLYVSFSTDDSTVSLNKLQDCLGNVQRWMFSNKLKLNPDKTEFLLIGHERQRGKYLDLFPFSLMNVPTQPSKTARNLGVTFDQNFNFKSHISKICSSCYYHIRDLRRIRKHLNLEQAKTLATSLIMSRLDYCNSLLQGLPVTDIQKLQRVQNTLARVVMRRPRMTHSAPLRRALHWLPVSFRIQFKISFLTYRLLFFKQPSYLSSLISKSIPSRSLRTNKGPLLSVPRVKTKTGSRAFSSCAPALWNDLPLSVRSAESVSVFRKRLKTHLFGLAFPP